MNEKLIDIKVNVEEIIKIILLIEKQSYELFVDDKTKDNQKIMSQARKSFEGIFKFQELINETIENNEHGDLLKSILNKNDSD